MGFDTLDCGFAASSPSEMECIRLIASKVRNAEICSIARTHAADIERAWEAVKDAEHPVIHPFVSTSPLHRQVKLGKTRDEVREMARVAVAQARSYTENVDFALEDSTRTEHDFTLEVCEVVLKEGVRFIAICDTVGFALPWEFGKLVADVKREFLQARISAHCHDDLGLAIANSGWNPGRDDKLCLTPSFKSISMTRTIRIRYPVGSSRSAAEHQVDQCQQHYSTQYRDDKSSPVPANYERSTSNQ